MISDEQRKPDGGLAAWIETMEAMGSGGEDAELLCLLLELRRRRENEALRHQPVIQNYKFPDGWRLVPDEPTEEMMRAMHQAQDMWPSAHCDNMRETQMSFARPRYIAALATAPKPPTDSTT